MKISVFNSLQVTKRDVFLQSSHHARHILKITVIICQIVLLFLIKKRNECLSKITLCLLKCMKQDIKHLHPPILNLFSKEKYCGLTICYIVAILSHTYSTCTSHKIIVFCYLLCYSEYSSVIFVQKYIQIRLFHFGN